MDLTFGTRLRLQRERQGVTLATIASDTKINPSLLEGLERDDVSRWPQGLFRRAYVRAYAQAIGLDPDASVAEFVALYPDPTDVLRGTTVWPDPDGSAAGSPSKAVFRRLVTAATSALPSFVQRTAPASEASASTEVGDEIVRHAAVLPPRASDADDAATPPGTDIPPVEAPQPASSIEPPVVVDRSMPPEITLAAAAQLCARLAQVRELREAEPVLADAVRHLEAVGLIVWTWDAGSNGLQPSLTYGYPAGVLARISMVPCDADNAVAAALRSGDTCVVAAAADPTGAVVVPMVVADRPVGVVALELHAGSEERESVRAFITILAAQLGLMLGSPFAAIKTA